MTSEQEVGFQVGGGVELDSKSGTGVSWTEQLLDREDIER